MKEKMKLNVSLSEKDKMILIVLVIALIVFCSYYFGYRNINAMTLEVKQETEELTSKYKTLYPLYQKKDDYVSETKKLTEKYDSILEDFPDGMTQEGLIVLAKSIEEDTNVWFSSVSMSEIQPVYTFGQVTSTNPSTLGASVYYSDFVGHKAVLTLSYQESYSDFKKMLEYFEKNESNQFAVEKVSMSYDEGDGQVSGSLDLAVYDITGSNRPEAAVEVCDVPQGLDNIFISRISALNAASRIISDYDVYVAVTPYEAGKNSVKVGLNRDAMNKSVIGAEANAVQSATLVIAGSNNNYTISYKVGDKMYPAENYYDGVEFNCGDSIDLLVLSSARSSSEDKAAVKLNITNTSDKPVNIFVYGDDSANPRVSLGTTTGQVNVEN